MAKKHDKWQPGQIKFKNVEKLGQAVVLIEIQGNIPIDFVNDGMLVGNWNQAHWEEATELCIPLARLAEDSLGISSDQFVTKHFVDRRSGRNEVSIGAGVFMRGGLKPVCLEVLYEPVAAFVHSVVRASPADLAQCKLLSAPVTEGGLAKSKAVVEEFLTNLGGTQIKKPLMVEVAGQVIVVKGKYKSQDFRDLPNPVESTFLGKVDGLRRSERKLWIKLASKEFKCVQFDVERYFLELLELLESKDVVEFTIQRQWSSPKKHVDRLINISALGDFVPDLFD